MNTKCPFCGHQHDHVNEIAHELLQQCLGTEAVPVTVCYGCYEILLVDSTGLNKPDFDTYNGLLQSGQMDHLNAIRRVSVRLKEKNLAELPVNAMWQMFRERTLRFMVPWPAKDSAEAVMRDIFMCGVKAGMVAYQGAFELSNGPKDFAARVAYFDDELEFFKADCQTRMERKAQRERTKNGRRTR